MRAKLILERFDNNSRLLERREQLSRSFTLEFLRLLYVQHAQASYDGITAHASNCRLTSPPGHTPYFYGQGEHYGIVVGEGIGAASPSDFALSIPIAHSKRFKAGAPAQFTNPGFETGDFTGWATNNSPTVESGGFPGSGGQYYCKMAGAATRYITQDIELTNVTGIRVAFHSYGVATCRHRIYVDADIVGEYSVTGGKTISDVLAALVSYAGVHTVKFEYYSSGGGSSANYWEIDNIKTWGKEFEYGGSELLQPVFSDPNGSLVLRRFFTNNSGNSITVNEAGILAYPGRLIVHDAVSPGIALPDTELLKVTYTMGITV